MIDSPNGATTTAPRVKLDTGAAQPLLSPLTAFREDERTFVAVSISLGSSTRNSRAEATLLGVPVILERIGVDGDWVRARKLYESLDGRVDAFGLGGADLGVTVNNRFYEFTSIAPLVAGLRTPVVDGSAVRRVIERRCVQRFESLLPQVSPKRVLIGSAIDRYDMARSFEEAGYELLMGDLGFVFGLHMPIRSIPALHRIARAVVPVARRMPFESLYPTGHKQEVTQPRFADWFAWATVLAGDFLFLRRNMPDRLDGKIIVTNTTTPQDVEWLRSRGAKTLITTTQRLDGRTFGTNVIEAALTAIAGKGRRLTNDEVAAMVSEQDLAPQIEALN